MFEFLSDVDNGIIQFRLGFSVCRWVIYIVEIASDAATRFWKDQVGGIGINMQDRVTRMVSDDCIGICCGIFKKAFLFVNCEGCRFIFLSVDIIQGQ